jgi:tRNA uridine 5-carboxymethylaminomethyl modification enzyme
MVCLHVLPIGAKKPEKTEPGTRFTPHFGGKKDWSRVDKSADLPYLIECNIFSAVFGRVLPGVRNGPDVMIRKAKKSTVKRYDVIVVGAGHAGCEAAYTAARLGAKTLLITINLDHIAQMSCNPAVGGVGKGQVVREIDAMGGAQGVITDAAAIQFRMLNRSKGPAVRSPRSQCDKVCFHRAMKLLLESTPNLDILQSEVIDIVMADGRAVGVENQFGEQWLAQALVFTTGTFLNGKMHFGLRHFSGGRAGDPASIPLSTALKNRLGLRLGRLKTGTPPRLLAAGIDFKHMHEQHAEKTDFEFSFRYSDRLPALPQAARRHLPCFSVYTTLETADIVRENLAMAPLYQGKIEGVGARYCPSFEDKVVRFAHHPRHLLYLEPEGAETGEYYINGISTSLPPEIQHRMIASVPGLEHAVISRYAYAIEYDFIFPDQLRRTLELKNHPNVFTAGQINGTSGYEEAAGQGLVAGLNAARYAAGLAPVELARDQSYIGVMIDDLVTKDIIEPYRLFTSRAEYRLHLRQDNADLRLSDFAFQLGLLPEPAYRAFFVYKELLAEALLHCRRTKANGKPLFDHLKGRGDELSELKDDTPLPFQRELLPKLPDDRIGRRVWQEILIQAHYDGYLQREEASIVKLQQLEDWKIPAGFDYAAIHSLSNESRQKLARVQPGTLAQAERIDGVTPSELALLQIHLTRLKYNGVTES